MAARDLQSPCESQVRVDRCNRLQMTIAGQLQAFYIASANSNAQGTSTRGAAPRGEGRRSEME